MVGTPVYLSPEMINEEGYNSESDIWSLGVLLYEMITFKMPFDGDDLMGLFSNISEAKYDPIPAGFSSDLGNLVGSML